MVNKLLRFEADNDVLKDMRSSQDKLPFNLAKDDKVKTAPKLNLSHLLLNKRFGRQSGRQTSSAQGASHKHHRAQFWEL